MVVDIRKKGVSRWIEKKSLDERQSTARYRVDSKRRLVFVLEDKIFHVNNHRKKISEKGQG